MLKEQRPYVGEYWSDAAKQIQSFANGDDSGRHDLAVPVLPLTGKKMPVAVTVQRGLRPTEGATGWSDTWMISSQAKHPNCMYKWMNWIVSPTVNAEVAQCFGEAPARAWPANRRRSTHRPSDRLCARSQLLREYHAGLTRRSGRRVYYWKMPLTNCGDSRGNVCKDYNDWVNAWTEIKG